MVVQLHEILDRIERRTLRCIGVTTDTDLHEMCVVAVRGVELLAEINHGEVVSSYFAVSTGQAFHLLLKLVSLLHSDAAKFMYNHEWHFRI